MLAVFKSIDKILEEAGNSTETGYWYGIGADRAISFIRSIGNHIINCYHVHLNPQDEVITCHIYSDPNGWFWPMWLFEEIWEEDDENQN